MSCVAFYKQYFLPNLAGYTSELRDAGILSMLAALPSLCATDASFREVLRRTPFVACQNNNKNNNGISCSSGDSSGAGVESKSKLEPKTVVGHKSSSSSKVATTAVDVLKPPSELYDPNIAEITSLLPVTCFPSFTFCNSSAVRDNCNIIQSIP